MAFIKQGIAPFSTVKCGCGQTLESVNVSCPKCGKNLRPLTNPEDKSKAEDKPKN